MTIVEYHSIYRVTGLVPLVVNNTHRILTELYDFDEVIIRRFTVILTQKTELNGAMARHLLFVALAFLSPWAKIADHKQRKETKMVKIVELKAKESDEEFSKNQGTFFDAKGFTIFDEDVDVYAIQTDEDVAAGAPRRKLLAKLRKNVIPTELVQIGWDSFRHLAIPSRNRGAAAGPIDTNSTYWKKRKPVEIKGWQTRYLQDGKVSKMIVNNVVASGVIGNYESNISLGHPCRMTGYTRSGLKYYLHGIPFLQAIDEQFKRLVPAAHAAQLAVVSKKPLYQISDTAFSTLTINMNFRTALHKDSGDFADGFGNLSVIEWGKYHGGETLFPRFGAGFNLRTGDFIAMDVHEWHCNAPVHETKEDAAFNKTLPDIRTRNPETGVIGSQELFQRLSFVCYFREKIGTCDEKVTRSYYKEIGFDQKAETQKARRNTLSSLPIPEVTGTLEEAIAAEPRGRGRGSGRSSGRRVTRKRAKSHE